MEDLLAQSWEGVTFYPQQDRHTHLIQTHWEIPKEYPAPEICLTFGTSENNFFKKKKGEGREERREGGEKKGGAGKRVLFSKLAE